jgi:hypothetical protein
MPVKRPETPTNRGTGRNPAKLPSAHKKPDPRNKLGAPPEVRVYDFRTVSQVHEPSQPVGPGLHIVLFNTTINMKHKTGVDAMKKLIDGLLQPTKKGRQYRIDSVAIQFVSPFEYFDVDQHAPLGVHHVPQMSHDESKTTSHLHWLSEYPSIKYLGHRQNYSAKSVTESCSEHMRRFAKACLECDVAIFVV